MVKQVSVLVVGSACAQLIMLAAIPLLTRVYSPDDFGVLAAVSAIAMILATVSSGRYEAAIPIKSQNDDSGNLLVLSIILLLIVSTTIFFAGYVAYKFRVLEARLFSEPLFFASTLFLLFSSLVNVLTFWSVRNRRFALLAYGRVMHVITTVALQLFLYRAFGGFGLVLGAVVGLGLFSVMLSIPVVVRDRKLLSASVTPTRMKAAALRYRDFPLFASWSVLLNSASNQFPNVLFFVLFSPGIAGLYSMACRVVRGPLSVIGQSVYQVFVQQVGQNVENRQLVATNTFRLLRIMAHAAFVPFMLGLVVVEVLFAVVLGEEWRQAGMFARIMFPWLFVLFLGWPLTALYNSLGYQRELLFFNGIFVFCTILPLGLAVWAIDAYQVVFIMSAGNTLARYFYIFFIIRELREKAVVDYNLLLVGVYTTIVALCCGLAHVFIG